MKKLEKFQGEAFGKFEGHQLQHVVTIFGGIAGDNCSTTQCRNTKTCGCDTDENSGQIELDADSIAEPGGLY
ncbi:MAG: hypothetical protein ACKV1O_30625 [Saprospiraceae bacterium]